MGTNEEFKETEYSKWGEFTTCPNAIFRNLNRIKKGFIKDGKGKDIPIPNASSMGIIFGYIHGFSKGKEYGYCYNGTEKIAWELGLNYKTVQTSLIVLEKIGLIGRIDIDFRKIKKDPGLKSGTVAYASNILKIEEIAQKEMSINYNNDVDRKKRKGYDDFLKRQKEWSKQLIDDNKRIKKELEDLMAEKYQDTDWGEQRSVNLRELTLTQVY